MHAVVNFEVTGISVPQPLLENQSNAPILNHAKKEIKRLRVDSPGHSPTLSGCKQPVVGLPKFAPWQNVKSGTCVES